MRDEGQSVFCMTMLPIRNSPPFSRRTASKLSQSPFCTPIHDFGRLERGEPVEIGFRESAMRRYHMAVRRLLGSFKFDLSPVAKVGNIIPDHGFPP